MNPLGRWLIALDGGSVALFIGLKVAGTFVSLGVLVAMYFLHRRIAKAVNYSLCFVQTVLFWFLTTF